MIAFPSERIRTMRRGPSGSIYQVLVPASANLPSDRRLLKGGVTRPLYRVFVTHDEDGVALGTQKQAVQDVSRDGELTQAVLTILAIERNRFVDDLTLETARLCGFRETGALRDEWRAKHPRTSSCHVVTFALGDQRDQPLFMNWTGGAGGDYTRNRSRAMDEAEALTREQMADLSAANRQKDDARRARASVALATETPSQRLLRLQRAVDRMGDEAARAIRQEMRIIKQRVERAEGRK